ncbi:MAG: Na+ dependent nucleoside transporter [Tannerella sp.]|jgi:CNT family concentrative nucleoside transporter|nr:Na+ dependent nucleoside transporter [Tannerella sp.]
MIESTGFSGISLLRGLLGVITVLALAYLFSENRKRIDWKLVLSGLLFQLVFVLLILYVPFIGTIFEYLGKIFVKIVNATQAGVAFLLGPYASKSNGVVFLIHSLPTLIVFSALVSLFYYWGIIQRVVYGFSWVLRRMFRNISGAEGLVVGGNIFIGMSESPLLAKNYLPKMNKSELFLVMVSGMATIAGTVMGAYIGILGGNDPAMQIFFAKHLLSASVMAAPGAIVIAKMFCPQTEKINDCSDDTCKVENKDRKGGALEALASGTVTGLRLMANVAAMLLVFISLVALVNYIFEGVIGHYTGLNDWVVSVTDGKSSGFSVQFILGSILSPLMWLVGVPTDDLVSVGALLGQKTILNEFVAYLQMQEWKSAGLFIYEKSIVMSTYMLCGFANIGSIGILIGALGILAPEKRPMIAGMGFRAMFAGALVSVLSATIVGMILG